MWIFNLHSRVSCITSMMVCMVPLTAWSLIMQLCTLKSLVLKKLLQNFLQAFGAPLVILWTVSPRVHSCQGYILSLNTILSIIVSSSRVLLSAIYVTDSIFEVTQAWRLCSEVWNNELKELIYIYHLFACAKCGSLVLRRNFNFHLLFELDWSWAVALF